MTKTREFFNSFFSKKMLIIFLLGFSSGLPFLIVGGTLKIWLRRLNVDIGTVGYFSWVGAAYSFKFVWAPLVDRYKFFGMGRRRSWMLATQVLLMLSIAFIATLDPLASLPLLAAVAVAIAFFSATQDIAIDAYRREILSDEELGLGSSITQYGYRVAMLITGGVGVGLVGTAPGEGITWNALYFIVAACMLVGFVTTWFAPEPKVEAALPRTFTDSVLVPFKEFFTRDKAFLILFFVFFFKLGDALGVAMLNPFYVDMGYTNATIGVIAKTVGLTFSLIGLFLGGMLIFYLGTYRSLWVFGFLQALATASFAFITYTGPLTSMLAVAVIAEDLTTGMGSVAFVAFLSQISDRRYTATQYAILSSIATLGRNVFSGFTGDMVKSLGWAPFFYLCAFIAILGVLMLIPMKKIIDAAEVHKTKRT